jgi:hypothetical protein
VVAKETRSHGTEIDFGRECSNLRSTNLNTLVIKVQMIEETVRVQILTIGVSVVITNVTYRGEHVKPTRTTNQTNTDRIGTSTCKIFRETRRL